MTRKKAILIELLQPAEDAFTMFRYGLRNSLQVHRHLERRLPAIPGLELHADRPAIPMFHPMATRQLRLDARVRARHDVKAPPWRPRKEPSSSSVIVSAVATPKAIAALHKQANVKVWSNSPLSLWSGKRSAATQRSPRLSPRELRSTDFTAPSDVSPATREEVWEALGVQEVYDAGFQGHGITVGIVDTGIDSESYPTVIGGHSAQQDGPKPGKGFLWSHGSMCAADVLTAAPLVALLDYRFSSEPNTYEAIQLLQAVLTDRRESHGPQIINCSFGFSVYPPREQEPEHEVWNPEHPVNRKVREVVQSGCVVLFSAGNCGEPGPTQSCAVDCSGPGKSIVGPASLHQVITVGAVTVSRQRLEYSAQGPGRFAQKKPDLCAYSHFYGHRGPNQDNPAGGGTEDCDTGTSAASPLAAGVVALLLNAAPQLSPKEVQQLLSGSARPIGPSGWEPNTGYGVIHAADAYHRLCPA